MQVWHEKWGEDYEKGGDACLKWTDRWSETILDGTLNVLALNSQHAAVPLALKEDTNVIFTAISHSFRGCGGWSILYCLCVRC